ncbi:hypothetical protein FEM48_Zijuj11G0067600 [Ziziphus jujuba var. spinosa]|uniref:Hyaluronan/mRNA-binding protein domain-containing protein n=1 Tax=Ziziphus jujuba var. spinosa TaxID=714518 RepID=A0A978UHF8_ZIZJJ|nr:hypothetical protein FEM48_Zijuj11G0067600 [Ziziphus jujuba var. spinosa]
MATTNPFDLLGDVDQEDPSQLIAAAQKLAPPPQQTKKPQAPSAAAAAQLAKPAKLPSKPVPPAQAGVTLESVSNESSFGNNGFSGGYRAPEEGDTGKSSERRGYGGGGRGGYRGGRRGVGNGEAVEGERPRRTYERRSGTGRGNELKREGSGRGNWGTPTDEIAPEVEEPVIESEKNAEKPVGDEEAVDVNKESPVNEPEEKEPEDKEMTLEEYEKVLEEKRKALLALKTEERKVNLDKDLESMQQLSSKKGKGNDDVFIKLGSEKDKRKEAAEKEEKAKKHSRFLGTVELKWEPSLPWDVHPYPLFSYSLSSVSINEFLKPAEGERYYSSGGRGRGRGRGSRGGFGGYAAGNAAAPSIEDPGQFPTLGGK